MSIDPMAALLQDNNDRISAAERLSHAHAALLESVFNGLCKPLRWKD